MENLNGIITMSELFETSEMESLSPQGAWMKKHNIGAFEIDAPDSVDFGDWIAWQGESGPNNSTNTMGHTKEQALLKLARRLKLTFYDNLLHQD